MGKVFSTFSSITKYLFFSLEITRAFSLVYLMQIFFLPYRMPAYDFSWWYSLFFIIYVIINTYIFMSVFLAVVYNNYRKHLKVNSAFG